MRLYTPQAVTNANGPEDMARQVNEQLQAIADALRSVHDFTTSREPPRVPQAPQVAPLRYVDGQGWNPEPDSSGVQGFYYYDGTNWLRLAEAASVYTYLPVKAFMLDWSPSGGNNPDSSYNINTVVHQGLGVYRITLLQGSVAGEDILGQTIPGFYVFAANKVGEGTVTAIVQNEGGTTQDPWFEVYLSETYVQGNSLRERPYILTGTEALTGFGLLNYTHPSAAPLPQT